MDAQLLQDMFQFDKSVLINSGGVAFVSHNSEQWRVVCEITDKNDLRRNHAEP